MMRFSVEDNGYVDIEGQKAKDNVYDGDGIYMYGTNTATVSVSDNAQLKIFSYGFGIYCQNIAVDGGKLNINAKRGFGVRATKDITIKNAEANVKSEYSAIYAHQNLLIEKSVVNAESKQGQGITVLNNDLTVTDSVVKTVVSDEKSGMRVSGKAKFKNSRINTSFEEKTEKNERQRRI